MELIFLGSTHFAKEVLEVLYNSPNIKIKLVITPNDTKRNRKKQIINNDVFLFAKNKKIDVIQTNNFNQIANSIKFDNIYLITCAFGQFLNSYVLNRWICLNIHPSLLPRLRGGAPINHALIQGETKTGVSLMKLIQQMDAGPIYFQEEILIEPTDDFSSLEAKLIKLTIINIERWLEQLPQITPKPQANHLATIGLNINNEMLKINWKKTCQAIINQVRGLTNIGAYTTVQNYLIKIYKLNQINNKVICEFGRIIIKSNKIIVQCKDGELEILKLQLAGKKIMDAKEFLNGNRKIIENELFS